MSQQPEINAGLSCKITDDLCNDRRQGSFGKCRTCPHGTATFSVQFEIPKRDHYYIHSLCEGEMSVSEVLAALAMQGIRSLKRHAPDARG